MEAEGADTERLENFNKFQQLLASLEVRVDLMEQMQNPRHELQADATTRFFHAAQEAVLREEAQHELGFSGLPESSSPSNKGRRHMQSAVADAVSDACAAAARVAAVVGAGMTERFQANLPTASTSLGSSAVDVWVPSRRQGASNPALSTGVPVPLELVRASPPESSALKRPAAEARQEPHDSLSQSRSPYLVEVEVEVASGLGCSTSLTAHSTHLSAPGSVAGSVVLGAADGCAANLEDGESSISSTAFGVRPCSGGGTGETTTPRGHHISDEVECSAGIERLWSPAVDDFTPATHAIGPSVEALKSVVRSSSRGGLASMDDAAAAVGAAAMAMSAAAAAAAAAATVPDVRLLPGVTGREHSSSATVETLAELDDGGGARTGSPLDSNSPTTASLTESTPTWMATPRSSLGSTMRRSVSVIGAPFDRPRRSVHERILHDAAAVALMGGQSCSSSATTPRPEKASPGRVGRLQPGSLVVHSSTAEQRQVAAGSGTAPPPKLANTTMQFGRSRGQSGSRSRGLLQTAAEAVATERSKEGRSKSPPSRPPSQQPRPTSRASPSPPPVKGTPLRQSPSAIKSRTSRGLTGAQSVGQLQTGKQQQSLPGRGNSLTTLAAHSSHPAPAARTLVLKSTGAYSVPGTDRQALAASIQSMQESVQSLCGDLPSSKSADRLSSCRASEVKAPRGATLRSHSSVGSPVQSHASAPRNGPSPRGTFGSAREVRSSGNLSQRTHVRAAPKPPPLFSFQPRPRA